MIIELNNIFENNKIKVEGEIFKQDLALYSQTYQMRNGKEKLIKHWHMIAHIPTGIILVNQAKELEENGRMINDRQMRKIAETLETFVFGDNPQQLSKDVAAQNHVYKSICSYVSEIVNSVLEQKELEYSNSSPKKIIQ